MMFQCFKLYVFVFYRKDIDDGDDEELPCGKLKGDDSSSEADIEWVPSSWSSLAQPSRSAMKSPDKSENVCIQLERP